MPTLLTWCGEPCAGTLSIEEEKEKKWRNQWAAYRMSQIDIRQTTSLGELGNISSIRSFIRMSTEPCRSEVFNCKMNMPEKWQLLRYTSEHFTRTHTVPHIPYVHRSRINSRWKEKVQFMRKKKKKHFQPDENGLNASRNAYHSIWLGVPCAPATLMFHGRYLQQEQKKT